MVGLHNNKSEGVVYRKEWRASFVCLLDKRDMLRFNSICSTRKPRVARKLRDAAAACSFRFKASFWPFHLCNL